MLFTLLLYAAVTAPLGRRHPRADGSRGWLLTIFLRLSITILVAATPLILRLLSVSGRLGIHLLVFPVLSQSEISRGVSY